jgi:hypothetical protein
LELLTPVALVLFSSLGDGSALCSASASASAAAFAATVAFALGTFGRASLPAAFAWGSGSCGPRFTYGTLWLSLGAGGFLRLLGLDADELLDAGLDLAQQGRLLLLLRLAAVW